MSDVFSAIADATRRQILDTLAKGGKTVSELVAVTGEGQPTISKHLKTLREAGLVSVEAAGQSRVYTLASEGFADLGIWLATVAPAASSLAGQVAAEAANELDAKFQKAMGDAGEQLGSWLAAGATWLGGQLQAKLSEADVDAKKLGRELGRQLADAKSGAVGFANEKQSELLDEVEGLKDLVLEQVKKVTGSKTAPKTAAKPATKTPAAKKPVAKKPAAKKTAAKPRVVTVVATEKDEF